MSALVLMPYTRTSESLLDIVWGYSMPVQLVHWQHTIVH